MLGQVSIYIKVLLRVEATHNCCEQYERDAGADLSKQKLPSGKLASGKLPVVPNEGSSQRSASVSIASRLKGPEISQRCDIGRFSSAHS